VNTSTSILDRFSNCLALAIVFALMVIFIQEGITYYISVQVAALFFLAALMMCSGLVIRVTHLTLVVFFLFVAMVCNTAVMMPDAVSQNSSNILVTVIGVVGYVAVILSMIVVSSVRSDRLLLFYRLTALVIITIIVLLVVVTELGIFAGVTREYFIFQNVGLITNWALEENVVADLHTRQARGVPADIDLFYGEPSFLALVLFVTSVSLIISSLVLNRRGDISSRSSWGVGCSIALFGGIVCMVFIRSLSSLIYSGILCVFIVVHVLPRARAHSGSRLTKVTTLLLLALATAWLLAETFPYYSHRLSTFSTSLSAYQRFGIVFELLPQDFLLGLHRADRIPEAGFHNSLIYIITMAGFGGITLLVYLMSRISQLAHPWGLATLSVLAVLAVFCQNGAVLSPNKLVLLSFILLPLSCLRSGGAQRL